MTFPGAPCVYYGDEIGMSGGKDPDCRRAFPWDRAAWDEDLRGYFKECIALRRRYRALRDGSFRVVYAEGKCVAYVREWGDEKLLVALNSGPVAARINVILRGAMHDDATLQVELGKKATYAAANGTLSNLAIPKRDGVVLRLVNR